MEKRHQLNTPMPAVLLDYIKSLSTNLYEIHCKNAVQNAYDYCELELSKEELEKKLAEVASKYYRILTLRQDTRLIHLNTVEPMKQYRANNLLTLYTLIFLQDHEDILGITEENRFNV
jgi:hypothetical protein